MILNKDVLVSNISSEISDNSTGQISPYDIRHNLLDIIDSVHLLTKGFPLDGSNFGTNPTRTTRVGEDALSKIALAGYFSIDNTAVGHSALRANYQGIKNTAVGSQALFCNVYGENNAGFGYGALGGNTTGYGNVGLGNFTLYNNKNGNFNIAIGHGAGYYAHGSNNKLFIASHNVDSNYICDNPLGSGLKPLVYGDLVELRFGIGVNSLHSDGTLQVGGHATPSINNSYNLGSSSYKWQSIYLSNSIVFNDGITLDQADNSSLQLNSNFVSQSHNTYSLGSQDNLWAYAFFNNLYVSGVATINRFNAIENCNYFCKTINLASSGNISLDGGGPNTLYDYSSEPSPIVSDCEYLTDEQLTGAGFNIQASGEDYLREYSFLFAPVNNNLSCLQSDSPYSRSSWNSNISIHLASGTHLLSDRIIFPSSINIANSSGCFGIFSKNEELFFSHEDIIGYNEHPSGYLAGVGNINFYSSSGNNQDYVINFASPESGVIIRQRFLNGIKEKNVDALNLDKDKLNGFEIQSIDDSNGAFFGPTSDRLVIGSYYDTSKVINAITLMKSDVDEGIFGVTNLTPNSETILPETAFNVRSGSNSIGRFTAENESSTIAAIQLLGGSNCLEDGFEISHLNGSGLSDISTYVDSGKNIFLRFYDNNTLGLFTSSGSKPTAGDMFTMGDSFHSNAIISMHQNTETIGSRTGYAKLYVKEKVRPNQQHSIYVTDGGAYLHDLIVNPFDVTDARGLYTDPSGNTFGGLYCPDNRIDLNGAFRNTAIGSGAIFSIINGDDNTVFGTNAASGITGGNRNNVFGSNSANSIANGNDNIVLGYNSFRNSSSVSENIIIGNNVGSGITNNYNFIVGQSSRILLEGKLGPSNSNKYLAMPSGGRFLVNDSTNTDSLQIRANYIDVIDRGGNDYPNNTLAFTFSGNEFGELFRLNHAADPMTNSATYKSPLVARPYAELLGDLKLRGAIRFSDFTSLDSASFLVDIDNLASGLNQTNDNVDLLFGSFVEGYVNQKINAPSDSSIPTTGILLRKDKNWQDSSEIVLVNRDKTSVIHAGSYVIAIKVNDEFRPLWISSNDTNCPCCSK